MSRPIKPYSFDSCAERSISDVLNELVDEVNEMGRVLEVVAALVLMKNQESLPMEQRMKLLYVMERMVSEGKI